ncbi:PilZ domain-containing protein [Stappia sp. MMSF_3263]|uniref:PilZ domain-containing protein n=1 Tax=Stappia sp. MMSF_3263 TaxID=3046693 RepID=UPI00273F72DA|nr:PilZ domain-containing protein [Stappia sp. MMSF_3263]
MDDSRKKARVRTLKQGRVVLAGKGGFGIDCRILNMSSKGARLKLETPLVTDGTVELVFLPENIRAELTIIWRKDNEIGVEFAEPITWMKNLD